MNHVSMVILAGGKSSRMGSDKSDLLLGEKTFLELQIEKGRELGISDILVSGYRGNRCLFPVVKDRMEEKGPLGGLEACFRQVKNPWVLVLCVDVPLVPVAELRKLILLAEEERKSVILRHGDRTEPMMGVYPADMADDMVEEILHGRGRIFHVLEKRGYQIYETDQPDELFRNVNDPEAYVRLLKLQKPEEYQWLSEEKNCICETKAWKLTESGEKTEITRTLLKEHRIGLYINGEFRQQMLCTGTHLEELVVGHLLTMGAIQSYGEVETIRFREKKTEAHVLLKKDSETIIEKDSPAVFHWKPEWVWRLEDAFAEEMELHSATKSAHAAFLMREGEILFRCEDMGRHNALDKAIGYALMNKIDLKQCVLFSSGRVPSDMAEKAVRAGVPMFVSRKTPTEEGICLAREAGLLLIGNVRNRSMQIFNEPKTALTSYNEKMRRF